MENRTMPIENLIQAVDAEVVKLNYCEGHIRHYRECWNVLRKYMELQGEQHLTAPLAIQFLKDRYGIDLYTHEKITKYKILMRRSVMLLLEYETSKMIYKRMPSKDHSFPPEFEDVCLSYLNYLSEERKLSAGSIRQQRNCLERFTLYCTAHKISALDQIDVPGIYSYIKTLAGCSKSYVNANIQQLKSFFAFLYKSRRYEKDIYACWPSVRVERYCGLPQTFTLEETQKLLAAVDRSNALGKRDYATRAARIMALKGFADFLNSKGARIKWPYIQQNWQNQSQFVPYIFTFDEVVRILTAADAQPIPAHGSQFHIIFPAILRVLYGTGLRISEALHLKSVDVDLQRGLLTVWNSKFDNSRCLPISASLRDELLRYVERRKWPQENIYFFPNSKGEPYSQRTVYDKFRDVLWQSGIPHGSGRKGPRVHDFRHTFAVHSLRKCTDAGIDTYTFLPVLATYLGHKKVSTTERYLRLTAEAYPSFLKKATLLSDTAIPEVQDYE